MVKVKKDISINLLFSIFLFILILSSGLKAFGYPIVDAILLGAFLLLVTIVNRTSLNIKYDLVFFFFIYLALQVFRGMFVLDDFRVSYFLFFFSVVYFSYRYFTFYCLNSKVDMKFIEKIYNFSFLYFVIYGFLGVLVDNPDNLQQEYWIGSSAAFLVIIPLLSSHFLIISKNNYSIFKLKLPSLMFCLIAATIHYSRIGVYLILFYILLLLFRSLFFNHKKIIPLIFVFAIALFTWDSSRTIFYINQQPTGTSELITLNNIFQTITYSSEKDVVKKDVVKKDVVKKDSSEIDIPKNQVVKNPYILNFSDLDRLVMIMSIFDKFVSSPTEFLFGSGWYTSRQKLKPFELVNRVDYDLRLDIAQSDKPMQITTLAAIVSDLGLVGSLFILFFFYKSSYQIIETKAPGRFTILFLLLSNGLFFLIGYSISSVIAFLLFLPDGIIVTLLRDYSSSNHLNSSFNGS